MGKRGRNTLYGKLLEGLEVTGFAAEGKAIARADGQVVFIPFAAPGDLADIRITKARSSYLEGVVEKLHRASEDRTTPFCKHFGLCGGCKWQHLAYDKQLAYKQQQLIDSLERIAKLSLEGVEVRPVIGADPSTFYRNKLEFTFSNRRWLTKEDIDSGETINDMDALGFHIPGHFDKVLDIEKCWLQAEPSNKIRLSVKAYALQQKLDFFDLRKRRGFLRNLIIRNTPAGECMVIVVFGSAETEAREELLNHIRDHFPEVSSLAYVINEKSNDSLADLEAVIYAGKPSLQEKLGDLHFQIGPNSFYQTNSYQAKKLYDVARDFAGLSGHEVVYDLYTGAGTIANYLASSAEKVIGIEYVEEAVEHARANAALNRIGNTLFFAGDMGDVLNEVFMQNNGYPHVVVTDPPRAGMHPKVIKQLIASGADRIVYVSCNPATQARDVELLSTAYSLRKVQAVDMFPHTQHVESVVLLERSNI
jgi:23S rRNA (uracil1939-C5)-methyltransferase